MSDPYNKARVLHSNTPCDKTSKNHRSVHISLCKNYILKLNKEYEQAFLEVRSLEEENSFLLQKLQSGKLPLSLYHKISLVIKQINERTYDDSSWDSKETPSLEKTLRQFVTDCTFKVQELYIGIVDVLYSILGRCPSTNAMVHFLDRYLIFSILDLLEDKFKYHSGYLVCSLLPPTEVPVGEVYENEIPGVVIGGWVRRYFLSKKVCLQDKIKLAMSLQNAKRAACAISERKQILATMDHQQNMLGHGYKEPTGRSFLEETKQKLDTLVKRFYPKQILNKIPIWRLPSQSACYEKRASEFGAMGLFKSKFHNNDLIRHCGNLEYALEDISFEMKEIPLYSFGFDLQEVKGACMEHASTTNQSRSKYNKILEPFKVRGITCSDGQIQQLGRLIQPVLHGCLRSEKGPFRFIGKRHNIEDINDVYAGSILITEERRQNILSGKEWGNQFDPTFFVAGDYKNATDNMHPELPLQFIDSIRKYTDLSQDWIHVLRLTLGSHLIEYPELTERQKLRYPDLATKYINVVNQVWGQLMGSPTSFPVLNLVNASMFWASIEVYENRKVSWDYVLAHYKPLFNGDDISFLSNIDHYKIWKEVCTSCGLSLSPGKNYCTKEFVNINSTNYRAKLVRHGENFVVEELVQEFLMNPGLVKGQSKVLSDTRSNKDEDYSKNSLMPLCDQLQECIGPATQDEKERVYDIFFYYMEQRLKKSQRPWNLPRHLGGLGLPYKGSIRPNQMALASNLIYNYRDLSDTRDKALFVSLGNTYFEQIKPYLDKDLISCIKPIVLLPNEEDKRKDLFPVPSFGDFFLTDTNADSLINQKIHKRNRKDNSVENKYIEAKRKISKKKYLVKAFETMSQSILEQTVELFNLTRLSKSGLTRSIKVSVRIPQLDISYDLQDDESCRPWVLFN